MRDVGNAAPHSRSNETPSSYQGVGPAIGTADDGSVFPSPAALFSSVTAALRREPGGFVSSKIRRAEPPHLEVPGLVVDEAVAKLELLLAVPNAVQLSRARVWEQVPALATFLHEYRREMTVDGAEVAAFVAAKLGALRHVSAGSENDDLQERWSGRSCLELALGMQLGEQFAYMPVRLLARDASAKALFEPSPELCTASWNHDGFHTAHDLVVRMLPAGALDQPTDADLFVRAHLLLQTRAFTWEGAGDVSEMYRLVPVADMLNHASVPNVLWDFNAEGDLIVKASRPIEAGEELLITYGSDKSNVHLFRNYGFTIAPSLERAWSFRVWPKMASAVYSRYLQDGVCDKVFDLASSCVSDSMRQAFRCWSSCGVEVRTFLWELCDYFRLKYEEDRTIAPALLALRRAREAAPSSAAWWDYLSTESSNPTSPHCDSGSDEWLVDCATRVKMSEYLCLTVHLEALALDAGTADAANCLAQSLQMRSMLVNVWPRESQAMD